MMTTTKAPINFVLFPVHCLLKKNHERHYNLNILFAIHAFRSFHSSEAREHASSVYSSTSM